MTKRLSPERIAEIRYYQTMGGCDGVLMAGQVTDLFEHIEAIEAELTAYRSWNENMSLEASKQEQRAVDAELELVEAKAEIARLKELRTSEAAEVVAWLAREAPELFARCKAALEKP